MKLLDQRTKKNIVCPKCKGKNFTEFDMLTETTTYHIWCKKKNCNTDLLIPVKAVVTKVIIEEKP